MRTLESKNGFCYFNWNPKTDYTLHVDSIDQFGLRVFWGKGLKNAIVVVRR